MIRILVFLIFIFHIQCLSDFGERTPLDASQPHNDNYDSSDSDDDIDRCKKFRKNCSDLDVHCLDCDDYPSDCIYGEYYALKCHVRDGIECIGDHKFEKQSRCQYCYQTEKWEHTCVLKHSCTSVASPPQYYKTNCTVHGNVMCLGNRRFPKKLKCNWTRGHKWSTALILSVTLGGFGADRFYLGHWQEGIGKLFSFGGLGVWTLVDVLLIAIRYLGPADGSFYV